MKYKKVIFVGLCRAIDASSERSSPCRRRRQELGLNKNPPLDEEDFDVEEGRFLLSNQVCTSGALGQFAKANTLKSACGGNSVDSSVYETIQMKY